MIDNDRAASVLLDAATYGDRDAARRWSISVRTLRNYRARLRTDKDFAAVFRTQLDEHEAELGALRVRFLRKALTEMERRLALEETTLPEIAEAVRVVGEMHQVATVVEDDESAGGDPETAEAQGGDAGAAHVAH